MLLIFQVLFYRQWQHQWQWLIVFRHLKGSKRRCFDVLSLSLSKVGQLNILESSCSETLTRALVRN